MRIILSIFFAFSLHSAFAQYVEEDQATEDTVQASRPESFLDRLYFGGNFGLQFGTYTLINLSPNVGYKITDKLSMGLGFTYQYIKYQDLGFHTYGPSVFARYKIVDYLFAHVENEVLNVPVITVDQFGNVLNEERAIINSLLVGGGYMQSTDNFGFYAMVLFNLTEETYTPYTNPIIRLGFGYGF